MSEGGNNHLLTYLPTNPPYPTGKKPKKNIILKTYFKYSPHPEWQQIKKKLGHKSKCFGGIWDQPDFDAMKYSKKTKKFFKKNKKITVITITITLKYRGPLPPSKF